MDPQARYKTAESNKSNASFTHDVPAKSVKTPVRPGHSWLTRAASRGRTLAGDHSHPTTSPGADKQRCDPTTRRSRYCENPELALTTSDPRLFNRSTAKSLNRPFRVVPSCDKELTSIRLGDQLLA